MSFDQMEYEDFSWIRWDRLRWDFVDLMISSAAQHSDRERSFLCTGLSCCLDIQKISHHLGFEIHRNGDDDFYGFIDFKEDLQSEVTSAMRDGMSMVSTYVRWGSGHPFEGHMEVPWEVARIANSSYFTKANRDDKFAPHVSDEPSDEVRDLLYAFVKLAFPDNFLAAVDQKNKGKSFEQSFAVEQTWFGEGLAWNRLIIREFFGGIQGLLMDSNWTSLNDQQIDLSHVRSLNQAIREIRGRDLEMFDKYNPQSSGG